MKISKHECPLCHHEGRHIQLYRGSYDVNTLHVTFRRDFYRCPAPKCGAVFYIDQQTGRNDSTSWETEREQHAESIEARRLELVGSDVYQTLLNARAENDTKLTKDKDLQKQFREIDDAIAQGRREVETFMDRMRNFEWEDDATVRRWVADNWLPPAFAEKSLESNMGMSRPTLRRDLPDEERARIERGDRPMYQAGQSITHGAWGHGTVVEGNEDGGTIIVAEFPERGSKRIDIRFAKLRTE